MRSLLGWWLWRVRVSDVLPLIDSVGYHVGFLSFRDLGVFSYWGGPVTLVRLVSRPRFG